MAGQRSKTKITSYFDRYPKFKGHEMGALTDPDTAARRREWKNALYYTTQTKVTSTLSSRLLLEGGYSSNVEYFTGKYQPGIEKTRGTPEWFSQTGHEELVGYGTVTPYPLLERHQYSGQRHRSAQARAVDVAVVRHRHAFAEDRRPVGLRPLHHARRSQRRPHSALSQRPARQRARLQHAAPRRRSS